MAEQLDYLTRIRNFRDYLVGEIEMYTKAILQEYEGNFTGNAGIRIKSKMVLELTLDQLNSNFPELK